MCTTLPEVLITVMGIEKVIPTWQDLEVFLQLLPRSSTGERMNPYTSLWTGVTPGDGPQEFHLVLLDNGRTHVLADEVGRQALHCIRCCACLNVCPVYERTGGHAYGSIYPGPIGAILTPQLVGLERGAVAAVRLEPVRRLLRGLPGQDRHPEVLVHLRARGRRQRPAAGPARLDAERARRCGAMARRVREPAPLRGGAARGAPAAQRPLVRGGAIARLPGPLARLDAARDLRPSRSRASATGGGAAAIVSAREQILARDPRRAARRAGGRARRTTCRSRAATGARGDRSRAALVELLARAARRLPRRGRGASSAGAIAAAIAARVPPSSGLRALVASRRRCPARGVPTGSS